jgi:hypothetical protein
MSQDSERIRKRLPDYFKAIEMPWPVAADYLAAFVDDEEQPLGIAAGPHARNLFHVAKALSDELAAKDAELARLRGAVNLAIGFCVNARQSWSDWESHQEIGVLFAKLTAALPSPANPEDTIHGRRVDGPPDDLGPRETWAAQEAELAAQKARRTPPAEAGENPDGDYSAWAKERGLTGKMRPLESNAPAAPSDAKAGERP